MFGRGRRSHANEIAHRIEVLREEIAHLGEALAVAAEDTTRGPRHQARRFAHEAVDTLSERAEELSERAGSLGAQAGALASSGLAAALRGRREVWRELDGAAARTQEVVVRHPTAALVAALGVGLIAACVLSLAAQAPRRQGKASLGGTVRRPSARASR